MSAISEWFGYQNAILTYIDRTYGKEELENYLDYLARKAYADITPIFRRNGIQAIIDRYTENFQKDGGNVTVISSDGRDAGILELKCPAFSSTSCEKHPDRRCDEFYCECCSKLEKNIFRESGYSLEIQVLSLGKCVWKIRRLME